MDRIEINFRQAKQQASQLEEIASRLERLARNDFDDTLRNISYAWKGESADAYLQKGGRLEENIARTAADLRRTAQTIRSTAQRTYNAEMRARELAAIRKYGGRK